MPNVPASVAIPSSGEDASARHQAGRIGLGPPPPAEITGANQPPPKSGTARRLVPAIRRCLRGGTPVCLPWAAIHMGDTPGYRRGDTAFTPARLAGGAVRQLLGLAIGNRVYGLKHSGRWVDRVRAWDCCTCQRSFFASSCKWPTCVAWRRRANRQLAPPPTLRRHCATGA